jgi:hypothetical protein
VGHRLDDRGRSGRSGTTLCQCIGEFDTWFKAQILRITGVDPSKTPLGPPTAQVFSWSDKTRLHADLLAQLTVAG